jgi:hypothetical protein
MRRIQSLFKTLLMLIPMTAVPMMAIFGIPQFFPVSASPSAGTPEATASGQMLERRVGLSDALLMRNLSTIRLSSIDLFQPFDTSDQPRRTSSGDVVANASSNELERRRLAWRDPLDSSRGSGLSPNARTEVSLRTTSTGTSPHNRVRNTKPMAATLQSRGEAAASPRNAPSFSGQAAIPSETAFSQTSNLRTSDGSSSAFSDTSSDEVTGDGGLAGRYSRLTSSDHANATESRSTQPAQVETLTWEQAVDRLNELGIRTFRLIPNAGQNGYQFICLVTSVDDPRISRRFEAESVDPLVAVADVLAQVENWNLHQ